MLRIDQTRFSEEVKNTKARRKFHHSYKKKRVQWLNASLQVRYGVLSAAPWIRNLSYDGLLFGLCLLSILISCRDPSDGSNINL